MEKISDTNYKIYESNKNNKLNVLLLKSSYENPIIDKCLEYKYNIYHTNATSTAIDLFEKSLEITKQQSQIFYSIVITALGTNDEDIWFPLIKKIREKTKKTFIIIFSKSASENPKQRITCFYNDCNMVTFCLDSLGDVLKKIKIIIESSKGEKLTCPLCNFSDLSEDSLWVHFPLYHINSNNKEMSIIKNCPSCNRYPKPNFQVHYRNKHGPAKRGEIHIEDFKAPELYAFSLVVVRRNEDNKFLLVQEFANSGYWLPGGRVDNKEDLAIAAIRETKEEAGIDIKLTGVLNVQFKNSDYARLRVIYYGEPVDESQKPKSIPDYESVGACYVDANDIPNLPLRGDEPLYWIDYLLKGGKIFPLSIFGNEEV